MDFVDNAGRVYARGNNVLYAVNTSDGTITWSFSADADLYLPAVLVPGGRILLFSDANFTSYLLGTTLDYAHSAWPVARTGNRRATQKAGDILPLPALPVSNQSPVLGPIGNKTGSENAEITFTVTASDSDTGDTLTLQASNLPTGANFTTLPGNPVFGVFTWTPTYEQANNYPNVLFTVTDNGRPSAGDSEPITITVGNVNRLPVLARIGDKAGRENEPITFTVTAADPDSGNVLTLQASNLPRDAEFTSVPGNPVSGLFTWTPGYDQAKNYQNVLFTVTDDDSLHPASATEAITITVNNVNRPPVLTPIGDQRVDEGATLQLIVTAVDPDGDPLKYEAYLEGSYPHELPSNAIFEGQTFSCTPDYSQGGQTYRLVFAVQDQPPEGSLPEVDVKPVEITVGNVDRPPVFSPVGSQTVPEGQTLQFTVLATDPDGDAVSYVCGALPRGAEFVSSTRTFTWSPDLSQAGNYSVQFDAQDPWGAWAQPLQVSITVSNVPTPCERVDSIVQTIDSLNLEKAVRNSYIANVKKVCQFVQQGKITPAVNELRAFIHKIEQDIPKGKISQADGDRLIGMANELIAVLSN